MSFMYSMLKEADQDGSNEVDLAEFIKMMAKKVKTNEEAELKAAFNYFDKDGSGKISPGELRLVMKGLGENLTDDAFEMLLEEADTDGDGEINYHEFISLILRNVNECSVNSASSSF